MKWVLEALALGVLCGAVGGTALFILRVIVDAQ